MAINEACQTEEEEHRAHRAKIRSLLDETFADLAPKLSALIGRPLTPQKTAIFAVAFVGSEEAKRKETNSTGWVYFVRAGALVKIGYTDNPKVRLDTLRTMSPLGLSLVARFRARKSLEKSIHDVFRDLRDHGEWFRYTREIQELVKFLGEHKEEVITDLNAMDLVRYAISLGNKIRPDDPMREEAMTMLENWITELDGLPSVDEIDEEEAYL